MPLPESTHLTYREVVGVELGVGRSLSLEPGGWGGGKLSKLWGGTNLVTILLLSGATPEDGVVPEMWVLLPHLSAESSLFASCWCLCRWWLDEDSVCTWRPPPTLDDSCTHIDGHQNMSFQNFSIPSNTWKESHTTEKMEHLGNVFKFRYQEV